MAYKCPLCKKVLYGKSAPDRCPICDTPGKEFIALQDEEENVVKSAPGNDAPANANQAMFGEDFWRMQGEKYNIGAEELHSGTVRSETNGNQKETAHPESEQTCVQGDAPCTDSLLTVEDYANVEDLGAEVFQMLDRFNGEVYRFGKEYTSACNNREKENKKIVSDASSQLKQLELTHTRTLDEIKQTVERTLFTLKMELAAAENDRDRKLLAAKAKSDELIEAAREKLNALKKKNQEQLKKIEQDVLSRITLYYGQVRADVSKQLADSMAEAKESSFQKDLTEDRMKYCFSEKCIGDVQVILYEINDETQKFFFLRRRLPELCVHLSILCGQIMKAFRMLPAEYEKAERAAAEVCDAEIAEIERNLGQTKANIQREFELKQSNVDSQRAQAANNMEARKSEENMRYQNARREKEEYWRIQKQNQEKRWLEELESRKIRFFQEMETVFPVMRMKALYDKLEALVEHINEPFKLGAEPMHSVAIGRAKVDYMNTSGMNNEALRIIRDWTQDNYSFLLDDPQSIQKLSVPYLMSVDKGAALLLKHEDRYEDKIKDMVNGIGVRMLWSVPASLQEFCLIDTAAIGFYAPLQRMDPAQNPSAAGERIKSTIIGAKVFQKKDEMARQIDEMRTRFDNRKGAMGSESLREYNRFNFMSREAYQAVMIQHFPMNLEADSVMNITTMVRDCRSAGFSAVLAMPETSVNYMEDPVKLRVKDMEAYMTVLQLKDDTTFTIASNCSTKAERTAEITLFPAPDDYRLEEMRASFYKAAMEATKVLVDFSSVAPEVDKRYQNSSAQGLVIPLGLMRGGVEFDLRMDAVHIHTVLSGVTGSGKTNLLHVLLLSTMLRYSPDEVEIYLIDFKHGVDFGIYSNYNLPNFRVISITSEAEFPLAALEEVEREFDRRAYELEDTLSIDRYNQMHPEKKMKRIILILDELYELMKDSSKAENKNIAERIMRIIDKIAHTARAFGIHMLISGQDITKIDGIDNIITQCANRIVMHSSDEDVKMLLGDGDASALMHEIKPSSQGTCAFSSDYAKTAKLAYTAISEAESQARLLEEISEHYTSLKHEADVRILLTEPSKSKEHPFRKFVDEGILPEKNLLFIGAPLTLLKDFNYYPDKNLWIIGGDSTEAEMAGYGTMFSTLLSLLFGKLKARTGGGEFEILCTDGSDDGTGEIDNNNRFWSFCDDLTARTDLIQYVPGNEISVHLRRLAEVIRNRREGESTNHPIWFLISRVEECYGITDQDKMTLRKILDDGPSKGVHTIFWTKNAEYAKRFQMSNAPCDKLILETADLEAFAVKIRQNAAAGYKAQLLGARGGTRLRLYDLPVRPWVDRILQAIERL